MARASQDTMPEVSLRFALVCGRLRWPILEGDCLVGRSQDCSIQLDDPGVSRVHARLTARGSCLHVEDLASRNGVRVDGARLEGKAELGSGSVVHFGNVQTRIVDPRNRDTGCHDPESLKRTDDGEWTKVVTQAHPLELRFDIVQRALRSGRWRDAERLVANALRDIEQQREAPVPRRVSDIAALTAVGIAVASTNPEWLDYTVRLHRALERPLPAEAIDLLLDSRKTLRQANASLLNDYARALAARYRRMTPNERFLAGRIDALCRVRAQ